MIVPFRFLNASYIPACIAQNFDISGKQKQFRNVNVVSYQFQTRIDLSARYLLLTSGHAFQCYEVFSDYIVLVIANVFAE